MAPRVLLWTERSGNCTYTSKGVFCIPCVTASTSALLFQPRGPASYFPFSLVVPYDSAVGIPHNVSTSPLLSGVMVF